MSREWILNLAVVCRAKCEHAECGQTWILEVDEEQLLPSVRVIKEQGYFLEDVSATDFSEGFHVIYHFDHWEEPGRITLKMLVNHEHPEVPSISSIFPGADWHERECYDFYGIRFRDHPNLLPLLLPEDLGYHPLIKEPDKRNSIYKIIPFYQMVNNSRREPADQEKEDRP